MRKSILAIAAVGTVFALTAAGASSLTVNAGPIPAGGTGNGTTCSVTVDVAYTADTAMPANIYSVDLTPTITGTGCDALPALVKVTWGSSVTGYAYLSSGLGSSVDNVTTLYDTAAHAIGGTTGSITMPTVAGFTSASVAATIAGAFHS